MKKISVIMGVYNCADTVEDAITSILNQTYENWELIVCDDSSQDETFQILKNYEEKYSGKIKVLQNPKNLRLAATLNHCLKYISGDYVARMDGDDISLPERFKTQVEFLDNHPEFDLVASQMIAFDETGDIGLRRASISIPDKFTSVKKTPFPHATIMCRRKVYDTLNGYRVSKEVSRCEDVDLWIRFFNEGNFKGYNLDVPLYKVREDENAYRRRSLKCGLDSTHVRYKLYKKYKYPLKYFLFALKPLLVGLTPTFVAKMYHHRRLKNTFRQ